MAKYELVEPKNVIYQIRALEDFKTVNGKTVKEGDLGGFVASEKNLKEKLG